MRNPINSSNLDERLKKLVQKKQKIEDEYRETSQRFWTILFVEISPSSKGIWVKSKEEFNQIIASYHQVVHTTVEKEHPCYIERGGGPQIVCAFEDPEICLIAAHSVLQAIEEYHPNWPEDVQILPSIGVHQGYVSFHSGTIHQSNTMNKTKRIQTEAGPGRIFVSKEMHEILGDNPQFDFQYVGSFSLKNIPEPQDIYEASRRTTEQFDAFSVPAAQSQPEKPYAPHPKCKSYQWIFLYIDVCESTKKFWKFGDLEASRLIHEYQELCHKTFTQYGCVYAKSCEGDQIIAAFETDDANSAAIAAIKILKDLFRRNVRVSENRQVRAAIGIHRGEMILEKDNPVTTNDMRVGKAIQSQASADEILLSSQVALTLDDELRKYIFPYGICEFTGISESYEIHSLNWTHVQLRPSLLHPPTRRKSAVPRISY
jgi:class 3 adenylate cyclase